MSGRRRTALVRRLLRIHAKKSGEEEHRVVG